MAERIRDKTPSEFYREETMGREIGSTSGEAHADVLTRTLGRERGLAAATGVHWDEPVIEGDEFEVVKGGAPEDGTGRTAPLTPNEELTEKKLERHGDVGGER